MVWRLLQDERVRGRSYQPRFHAREVMVSWLGGLLAITSLAVLSQWSHYPLVVAPFGASSVLLFGHPSSPLAQPRNLVLGNTVGAAVSVICVTLLGAEPLVRPCVVSIPRQERWLCWGCCSKPVRCLW